ncbi:hypothetical protein K432DRAFT_407696 [Lepidopterella palustris CBS 459.81]|uniref:Uncharacterized protein n=1 Tax=Lepidopterella palustris CBS 459.81 TaxID=1314670 RepID=A0A8E2E4G3_9PEZI|nr:hypothetical protein K432DRAFT_407696 [Lepidopterella palustris CBS 459.81]
MLPQLITITTLLAASAHAISPYVPAEPIERRYPYAGGGWALMTSGSCPSGTYRSYDVNLDVCCPNGMAPQDGTGPGARVCCTESSSCLTPLQSEPFCADSTWVLWNATTQDAGRTYFCCLPNQIGTQDLACVGGSTNVAASLSAVKLNEPTPTGLAANTFSASPTASDSVTSDTGVAMTTSASVKTTTASAISSTHSGGIGGIISAVASHVSSDGTALTPMSLEVFGLRMMGLGSGIAGVVGVVALVFAMRV